ncbi:hypothetical protein ACQY0O_007275 [Thecaphora frezii]
MASCTSLSSLCSASTSSSRAATTTFYQALSRAGAPPSVQPGHLGPCQAARLANRLAPRASPHSIAAFAAHPAPSSEPLVARPRLSAKGVDRRAQLQPAPHVRSLHSGPVYRDAHATGSHTDPYAPFQPPSSESRDRSDVNQWSSTSAYSDAPHENADTASADDGLVEEGLLDPYGSAASASALGSSAAPDSIADSQLLELLQTPDSQAYLDYRRELPVPIRRIDAYLMLRQRSPQLLSQINDWHLTSLFRNATVAGFGAVLRLLIDDLLGPASPAGAAATESHGLFDAAPGTDRRIAGLKSLLLSASRDPSLQLGKMCLQALELLMEDIRELQSRSEPSDWDDADGDRATLPRGFPPGETRTLLRTIMRLGTADVVPAMQALQTYLVETTQDFPTAREGSRLIGFYLSEPIQEPRAALEVAKLMLDTQAIGHDVLLQAQEDGQEWLAHARERLSLDDGDDEAALEPLRRRALEITLRIVGLKAMMAQRPLGKVQLRHAFEDLLTTLREAPGDRVGRYPGSPVSIAAKHFRSAFLLMLGQPGDEGIANASSMLQRCDRNVLALVDSDDLQYFCEAALAAKRSDVASTGFLTVLKAKSASLASVSTTPTGRLALGSLLKPETLLRLLEGLVQVGQSTMVHGLLLGVGLLPLADHNVLQWDKLFSYTSRPEALQMLANADLQEPALALYQRWAHFELPREDPSLLSRRTKRFFGFHRRAFALSPYEFGGDTNTIACSSSCMLHLVRMLTKDETFKQASRAFSTDPEVKAAADAALRDLDAARWIVEVFKAARPPTSWSHYDITSLANACFRLRDSVGAFDALQALIHRRELPDEVDVAVLLGGLMTLDPDRAVQLLALHTGSRSGGPGPGNETVSEPSKPPFFRPTANIISQLIARAATQERFDLVQKLLRIAEEHNLQQGVSLRAWRSLATQKVFSSLEIAQKLQSLFRGGFRPDGAFLDFVARQCLHRRQFALDGQVDGAKPEDRRLSELHKNPVQAFDRFRVRKDKRAALEAALNVTLLGYRELGVVNLGTVALLLKRLRSEARSIFPAAVGAVQQRKGQVWTHEQRTRVARDWIAKLDRLVAALRWTPLFDKGSDLRRGLPLWKSGQRRDGKLAMYDQADMVDATKRMREGYRKYSRAKPFELAPTVVGNDEGEVAPSFTAAAGGGSGGGVTEATPREAAQGRRPNVLPLGLFRDLMGTYLSLQDDAGAAEVAAWMRDEAHADVAQTAEEQDTFVRHVKQLLRHDGDGAQHELVGANNKKRSSIVLEMLAGRREVARAKAWWTFKGIA